MKNKWIYIIFSLALAVRVGYFLEVKNTPVLEILYIDSEYYHNWAASISKGDILGGRQTYFMAPLYAYFLALVYSVLGTNFLNALIIQILIGSFSCVLLFLAGKKYFDDNIAVISGILCAVYPVFVFYDAALFKENLMIFFLLLLALVYPNRKQIQYSYVSKEGRCGAAPQSKALPSWGFDSGRVTSRRDGEENSVEGGSIKLLGWNYLISGVLIGLNALLRPTIFMVLPFLFVYEYFENSISLYVKKMAVLLVGIAIIVFPVARRNKVVGGEWVLTVASGGMNFWTGNNPKSNGAYAAADFITSEEPGFEEEDFRREASRRNGRELSLGESSKFWQNEALKFIYKNPGRFAWLMYRKFAAFWHNTELSSNLNFYFARDFSGILRYNLLTFGIIVPFSVLGFYLSRKYFRQNFILWAIPATNFLSAMIFFNASQYRLPVVPFFLLFSGVSISVLSALAAKKEYEKIIMLSFFAVPVFLFANYRDTILENIPTKRLSYLNAATYYARINRNDRAEEMLKKSLEIDPNYGLALKKYADLLQTTGRPDEAKLYFSRAMSIAGAGNDSRLNKSLSAEERAYLLFAQKKYGEALELFLKISGNSPLNRKELHNNIGLCYLKLNDFVNARKEFLYAISIDKNYDKAYYNLGVLFEKKGDFGTADKYFNKTLQINPNYEKAKRRLNK